MSVDPVLLYLVGDLEDPVVAWWIGFKEELDNELKYKLHSLRLKDGDSI